MLNKIELYPSIFVSMQLFLKMPSIWLNKESFILVDAILLVEFLVQNDVGGA